MKNKHGLSRNVPPDVKYKIRKTDYFGCIHCGLAVGVYEHIDPEFHEAIEHDPSKMAFLCDNQNQKKERGFLSKETIWKWKANPWGKTAGHCHDSLDIGTSNFSIWLCGDKVEGIENVISIGENVLLAIRPPEENGAPIRLSAVFHDTNDKKILEIIDNEWTAASDAFDIVCTSGKIGIRQGGKFVLKIYCFPPNQIVIDTIDMLYKGFRFIGNSNSLEITKPNGDKVTMGGRLFKFTAPNSSLLHFHEDSSGTVIGPNMSMSLLTEKRPHKSITSVKFPQKSECPCGKGKKYKHCCYPKYDYTI